MSCDEIQRAKLNDLLKDNKITVMSTNGCPSCVDAKTLLKNQKMDYYEKDLSQEDLSESFFHCIFEKTKTHYVPQIFINSKYVGGYRELQYLNSTKLLDDLYSFKV